MNSTKYDLSSDDPRIVAALAARAQLDAAFACQDGDAFASLTTPDFVVHGPNNVVVQREVVVNAFRKGVMNYREGKATSIEFVGVRGDWVVLMGEETIRPIVPAPHAGKTLRRRFTGLWRESDGRGSWPRQATIISAST